MSTRSASSLAISRAIREGDAMTIEEIAILIVLIVVVVVSVWLGFLNREY
jgi:hypothetical protein